MIAMTLPADYIQRVLKYVAENPDEFLCPGIRAYRSKYEALNGLFDELDTKLNDKARGTLTYRDLTDGLRTMERHLREGAEGYMFVPVNTDRMFRYLEFLTEHFRD